MQSFGELYARRLVRALHVLGSIPRVKISGLAKRRQAIKRTADLSLALTAQGSAWSRALMKNALSAGRRKKSARLPRSGDGDFGHNYSSGSGARRESILRHIRGARGRISGRRNFVSASAVARSLVSRRIKLLRNLIPGGNSMNYRCLLAEAADYIASLKIQVEVMEVLANARSGPSPSADPYVKYAHHAAASSSYNINLPTACTSVYILTVHVR